MKITIHRSIREYDSAYGARYTAIVAIVFLIWLTITSMMH